MPLSRADIVKKTQDLSYLSFDELQASSGLLGSCAKAREGRGSLAIFYKKAPARGNAAGDQGLFAQLLQARLMDALGIEHVPFKLVYACLKPGADPVWIAKSKSYRQNGERAIALPYYWELACSGSTSPLQMCVDKGWEMQVAWCFLIDYLCAVRDRDETCFEVLADANQTLRLSPVQPRGFSFANAFVHDMWRRDALADLGTDNYLGSASLEDNLAFAIERLGFVAMPAHLEKQLFTGLEEIASSRFLQASWHIVKTRWEHYESLCRI